MFFLKMIIMMMMMMTQHCQTTINANTHKFCPKYAIVAIDVETISTLNISSALHIAFRSLQNSIFSSIETNID